MPSSGIKKLNTMYDNLSLVLILHLQDMHICCMCRNILHNIKAVAQNLSEEITGQTMCLYPYGRTDERTDGRADRGKLICLIDILLRGHKKGKIVVAITKTYTLSHFTQISYNVKQLVMASVIFSK